MYEDIIMANGARYACSAIWHATDSDKVAIDLPEMTLADAASIFSDPNNTSSMQRNSNYFAGYTDMIMLTKQSVGVEVILRRPQ